MSLDPYLVVGDHITREDIPADVREVKARNPAKYDHIGEHGGFTVSVDTQSNANDPERHKITYDMRKASAIDSTKAGDAYVVPLHETSPTKLTLAANTKTPIYHNSLRLDDTATGELGSGTEKVRAYFPPSQGARADKEYDPPDPEVAFVSGEADPDHAHTPRRINIDGAKTNVIKFETKYLTQSAIQCRRMSVTGLNANGTPQFSQIQFADISSAGLVGANSTWVDANAQGFSNTWETLSKEEITLPANWLGVAATSGHTKYIEIRARNSHNKVVTWGNSDRIAVHAYPGEGALALKDPTATYVQSFNSHAAVVNNNTAIVMEAVFRYVLATHIAVRRAEGNPPEDNDFSDVTFEYATNVIGTAWNGTSLGSSTRTAITPTEGKVDLSWRARYQPDNKTYFYQILPIEISGAKVSHANDWSAPYTIITQAAS